MKSRDKILQNIKSRLTNRVDRKNFNYQLISYEDRVKSFIEALQRAGGEIVTNSDGFDVVLEAKFAVAENGACFISGYDDRKIYSYYETIAIKLKKDTIVNNMQEALKDLKIDDFGIFLSGPSKTADIEQSLVIGAHGAKKLGVILL